MKHQRPERIAEPLAYDHAETQAAAVTIESEFDGLAAGSSQPSLRLKGPAVDGARWRVRSRGEKRTEWIAEFTAAAGGSIPWVGPPLRSRQRRSVSVAPAGADPWSTELVVEAGLLAVDDWTARFVGPGSTPTGIPVFRKVFELDDRVVRARLYLTYLGIGRVWINGQAVGDAVLEPGWQSYGHRLVYRTHDVTDLLRAGVNEITAEVAPGWYSGRVGFFEQREVYGKGTAVLAQLEAELTDGTQVTIATDDSWSWREGPTRAADLYDGETFDSRMHEAPSESRWSPVRRHPYDLANLEASTSPPVRRIEEIVPVSIFRSPSGKTIVDFGRNIVGWTRIRVAGERGTEVVVRHAEVLENGELGTRPLRSAAATDRLILSGEEQTWEPSYTYHGFRYIEVEGWPAGEPAAGDITAVVISSDLPRTGWFRTSHAELSTLHSNVVASMQGNFVSIPTDCPQRDERLGWTGDIAIFAPTAMFLYECTGFLRSWLRDVGLEQEADGRIPIFVPQVPFPERAQHNPQFDSARSAVWGDAATIVPFAIYQATGDTSVLAENFDLMQRWVDGVAASVGPDRIWDGDFQFGDWLDPAAPPEDPGNGLTEPALISTAYLAHSARLVARAADLLGDPSSAARYRTIADEVTRAFRGRFVADDGTMSSDSQTAYAIALCLELLETDDQRRAAGARLATLVRENGHRIGTGFVGTPLILDALGRAGAIDDAYGLLLQRELPSWLYAVSMGATTIWERWDSMLPSGAINPGEMTSFNHYALGAVADWLHSTVAGISALEPGYRRIRIAPRPRAEVRDAGATHLTPFGPAAVDWRIDDDILEITATVPEGTTAVFDLEGTEPFERGAGVHVIRVAAPVKAVDGHEYAGGTSQPLS